MWTFFLEYIRYYTDIIPYIIYYYTVYSIPYNICILGTHCEIADNACVQPNVCQNGGSCRPDGQLGFECICPDGFYGPRCENEIDECIEQPCSNGAECINKINDFECICPAGWMGKTCQIGKFKVKGHLIVKVKKHIIRNI